jgi:AraC family transcriptional regulator of arabinose operon
MEKFLKGDFSELKLTECGYECCGPMKDITADAAAWHRLHYILYGKGFFKTGDGSYELKKGYIFYIPPGKSARYYPEKNEPWTYVWLGFNGDYADRILNHCCICEDSPIVYDKNFVLKPLFMELTERYGDGAGLNMNCMSAALKIFWELMSMCGASARRVSAKEQHIQAVRQYIENNYQFPITVRDIAGSLGLSPNYLANIFSEKISVSPKEYLIRYRIDKACGLLAKGGALIKDIALSVGYKDPLHFSAEFKRLKKVSPSEYRKPR